jgi:hypothetical protein
MALVLNKTTPNKEDSERTARPSDESVLNYISRANDYELIAGFAGFQ